MAESGDSTRDFPNTIINLDHGRSKLLGAMGNCGIYNGNNTNNGHTQRIRKTIKDCF